MKSMTRNKIIIYNVTSVLTTIIIGFISGPIVSKALGTDNYGVTVVFDTLVQFFIIVFPISLYSSISLAKLNYSDKEQLQFRSCILFLSLLIYASLGLITSAICWFNDGIIGVNLLTLIAALICGWGCYSRSFIETIFIYDFKAKNNFLISLIYTVIAFFSVVIFILVLPKEINYWSKILSSLVLNLFFSIWVLHYVIKKGKKLVNTEYWKFAISVSSPIVIHLFSCYLLDKSDTIMIKYYLEDSKVGIYGLTFTFCFFLKSIWVALNNSWNPFFVEYLKNPNDGELKKHIYNYLELYTIMCVGFILLAKDVFCIYASNDFWEGIYLIPIFVLKVFFDFLYTFPANYEFYYKKTKIIAIWTVASSILNIVLNYILIPVYGMFGAVFASMISMLCCFLLNWVYAKNNRNFIIPFGFKTFVPWIMLMIITCVAFYCLVDYIIIRWMISAVLGIYILIKIIKRKEII